MRDLIFRAKRLDNGEVCCVIDINNYDDISTRFEPKTCDEIVKDFASCLKSAFGKTKATYIYNGNGSFVVFVKKSDAETVRDIISLFELSLGERDVHRDVEIEYKAGIAEDTNGTKTIRKLLTEAIKNKKSVEADIEL